MRGSDAGESNFPALPEAQPEPERGRAPRWPVVLVLLVAAVWLERQVVTILASPDPARQARFFLDDHSHGMVLFAACAAAWPAVRKYNEGKARHLSYPAVCAVLVLLLNPIFVDRAFRAAGLRGYTTDQLNLVNTVLLAIGLCLAARLRVSPSLGALRGGDVVSKATLLVLIGVVVAALIVVVLAVLVFALEIGGMSGH